ncbi:MAG TPA: RDD family protein [Bryobacteraceae bacterium]|nr:RDD family protein [Bryobacteraceae bacterium]
MAFCTNCGAQNQDNTQFCTACGARLGAAAPTPPPPPPPGMGPVTPGVPATPPWSGPPPATPYTPGFQPGVTYAQWPDRAVGYLIDSLIVGVVMGILYGILGGILAIGASGFGDNFAGGMCCVMIVLFPVSTLVVGIFNRVYLVSKRGSSIGQGVMKLKVVDANGNLLSFGTALLRLLAQIGLGLIPLGTVLDLLWPLWDDKRQTLHDKAVSSFVIKQA